MYLKSLEMQGFKSFPDKTKLTFEGGSTVIVGPNGSGKSNISDAMRWVLGEVSSKSIRGTKMEDIIFGGADSRKPMGYAEVSVTFDNTGMIGRLDCPYDEVTVTRRYYRAGESEYYINRRAVRLRDIYELFMNTGIGRDGYSIIGQGKIAEIVSKKSDERRSIFEDASGIAKYRHKKSETERKLKATEENMTRINDVFAEVAAQVGPLEKESEKAKKAIDLLETKKRVDVQLWLYDTERLRADIAKTEESFKHAEFDLQTAEDSIRAFEVQNERLFEASQSNKLASEKLLGEIRTQTNENHALDSEYRVTATNILHTKEMIAEAEGNAASVRRSIENERVAGEERIKKVVELEEALDAKNQEYETVQNEQKQSESEARELEFEIARALDDIRVLDAEAVDIKVRMSVLENARESGADRNTAILGEIAEYEKISDELKVQSESIKRTVDEYQGSIDECDGSIEKLERILEGLYAEREELTANATSLKLRADSVAQRIETFRVMEQQFEGYSGSVRFVMKQYAENKITDKNGIPCGKIYGPLSKVISVEDKFVTAIETALGANLQHIVVEDESVAKAAMFALRRAEAGRATFFPLTSMRGQKPTQEMREASGFAGYIAVADELVGCDSKFSEVVSGLLGRTLIFDNIDNATAMAKSLGYRVKAVTLDGQQINVGGSFTGGSVKQKGNILGRAGEIKRLEGELEDLTIRLKKAEKELSGLSERISENEYDMESAEEKRKILLVMQGSEQARYEQITAKLDANETLISKLRADFDEIDRMKAQYDEDIEEFLRKEKELKHRIAEISAVREAKDIEREAALDRKSEAEEKMTALFISISEIQKDIETERAMMQMADSHIIEFTAQLDALTARIAELEAKIAEYEQSQAENRQRFEEGERNLARLNAERAKIEEGGFEFERKLNEVNSKMREKMSQKELIFRDYSRLENKLSNLREEQDKLASKLWDEHELTRNEAVALGYPAIDASQRPEIAAKQTECRNKLRALGSVDLDAVNKYKEVKARYDYMDAQIKDLSASRDDLLDIINKLEGEMKTAFIDSFQQINENFNRVFGELFGGGSAELSLTDPDNVLESGIEIKAAPPGKIIKNLVQLSGGEQSFIAIALFFAILQVNPTPFCILDEIEAALDEVNVARFAEYIKRYASGTQFILITHRRGTMEAANRLYGVTMPERGISKVLELDIGEISKKKGEDWDGIFG
ncbi:MAG: chromosome segregation protein SMC [Clostridia bacterium]|nr:chromosome segregation protein SMC [Clostridia bacterium]